MSPSPEKEDWPVIEMWREAPQPHIPLVAGAPFPAKDRPPISPTIEGCSYYPADHPAVLTPDEARLLMRFHLIAPELEDAEDYDPALRILLRRLQIYADEGGHS